MCKIDLEHGVVMAHSPAPKNEIPGNLLFYDGDVVSQTETTVTAYPQVDAKVAEINALLQKNPKDPVALTERGELRLYQGRLEEAVADLRAALGRNEPSTLLPRTRNKLYVTLTELLRQDFKAAEPYLQEYKELCQNTGPRRRERRGAPEGRARATASPGRLLLFAGRWTREAGPLDGSVPGLSRLRGPVRGQGAGERHQ